jgi:predicted HD superfamily hydrolase involved in NAD metabolism
MINEKMLDELRTAVSFEVSAKRFEHICGVERCARRLGEYIIPEQVNELRAAALLHDVSKELPLDEQIALLKQNGFELTEEDMATEGVLHSFTAPIVIRKKFPNFATDNILRATENHTVGRENMSVFEKIIFVSDYAEDTRKYPSCIAVRERMFLNFEELSLNDRLRRLDNACLESIDGALGALKRMGAPINSRMYKTKDSLLKK